MADAMEFPNDWAKFLEDYSFRDHEGVYTNGARLIPTFRVEQMMHHYLRKATEDLATDNNVGSKWIPVTERLPIFTSERRRSVLVTLEDRQGKRLVTTAKYNPEYEEWYEFKDSRFYDFKVLAWMPKPERYEPPKEETNGRSDC